MAFIARSPAARAAIAFVPPKTFEHTFVRTKGSLGTKRTRKKSTHKDRYEQGNIRRVHPKVFTLRCRWFGFVAPLPCSLHRALYRCGCPDCCPGPEGDPYEDSTHHNHHDTWPGDRTDGERRGQLC